MGNNNSYPGYRLKVTYEKKTHSPYSRSEHKSIIVTENITKYYPVSKLFWSVHFRDDDTVSLDNALLKQYNMAEEYDGDDRITYTIIRAKLVKSARDELFI